VSHYNAHIISPEMSLPEMLRYGGYWGYRTPSDPNATFDFKEVLIDEPANRFTQGHNLSVQAMGLRAQESYGRSMGARKHGELYQLKAGGWHLCPLAFWRDDDVWAYIASRKLRYNAAYDRMAEIGMPRTEWRVSTFFGESASGLGRYANLKRIDPGLWNAFAAEFPKIANMS
jgi:predicted phosphoadenosine phosphosulfate sulfurtransferase